MLELQVVSCRTLPLVDWIPKLALMLILVFDFALQRYGNVSAGRALSIDRIGSHQRWLRIAMGDRRAQTRIFDAIENPRLVSCAGTCVSRQPVVGRLAHIALAAKGSIKS